MVDPDRFKRVTALFEHACKLEDAARDAYLTAQCEDDADLQHEVQAMLDYDKCPGAIPASGAGEGAHLLAMGIGATPESGEADLSDEIPIRIGRYQVIRKVGEGGMGVVFEARQEKPSRIVALKVIRPGLITRQVVRRFEYEAEVLGHLRHPGIAQIFEAGTAEIETKSGILASQPFFAMEFIRGRSLIDYANSCGGDSRGLNVRQRLALFAKVCDALQHAHQTGVIHRDLKPENILVDDGGEPKILDFGVARVVESEMHLRTLQTELGQLVGTLAYMSPEQIRGNVLEVDTRSDVYAAGVVLYQLLAGRLPFKVRGRPITDAAHTICHEIPAPVGTIDAMLRGDVETIVAKALEKDKTRRYQTAGELSRDIRHYLEGEPIEAKRDSAVYVLSKTLSRHKAAAGTAMACALLIIGSTIALWFMYVRQSQATEMAQAEAIKANTVIELLQEMVGSADPDNVKGRDYTVRQLLDEFAAGLSDQLADQPEVNATIHATIGNAYLGLAEFDEAESHLSTALKIRRGVFGDEHAAIAANLGDLATLQVRRGNYHKAEGLYRDALTMHKRLFESPHARIASSLNNLGELLGYMGESSSAESLLREALAMRRQLFGDEHGSIAETKNNLALFLQHMGEYVEAEQLYREALALNRELLVKAHPRIATNAYNLGSLLMTAGHFDKAEALFRESLKINRERYGDEHPSVSASMIGLASLLRAVGELDEAVSLNRKALATSRKLQGAKHPDHAVILNNLANVLKEQGAYEEAKSLHLEALDLRRRFFGDDHAQVANSLSNLAGLLKTMGALEQAESVYQEAITLGNKTYGDQHPRQASILHGFGELLYNTGRYDEAKEVLDQALAIRTKRLPRSHRRTTDTARLIGQCLIAERKYEEAESVLIERYEVLEGGFETRTPRQRASRTKFLQSIHQLYDAWGKPEEAARWRTKIANPDSTGSSATE